MHARVATLHTDDGRLGAPWIGDGSGAGDGDQPPRCQLIVIEGPDMGRAVPLHRGPAGATRGPDDEVVIGTGAGCDLLLTDDRVSRRHMTVHGEGAAFVVRDLQSSNGTRYEGSLIGEVKVGCGATFKIGKSYLRIQAQPQPLLVAPSQSRSLGALVAESLAMREVFAVLEMAAGAEVTVLLEGETGTGKELAARAVHDRSPRNKGPFVAIDCGALPETLLESELFGHVKGAFSNASRDRDGAFLSAHGGTLFLDELGSVPHNVQARLLRVLEERKVRQVGADRERPVDVRILAASPTDLSARVAEGSFRPDLFYRLSVVRVTLPPLRARREDIAPIVAELLRLRKLGPGRIAGPGLARLLAHPWPGNVRELRNVIDRAIALSPGATGFADLRIDLSASASEEPLAVRTDLLYADAKAMVQQNFERRYLRDVFVRCKGNISATQRATGIDRKHLRDLLRRHGMLAGPEPAGPADPAEPNPAMSPADAEDSGDE